MDREALRVARSGAVQHLSTLTDIMVHRTVSTAKLASFGRLNVEVVWCNGRVLFARWNSGEEDNSEFPWHIHAGVSETIGVLEGAITVFYRTGEPVRVVSGGQVYIAEGIEHRVVFEQGGSSGWLVLVPPDRGVLPYADDGCCALRTTPKCAGKIPECLAFYRDEVSGDGDDGGDRSGGIG